MSGMGNGSNGGGSVTVNANAGVPESGFLLGQLRSFYDALQPLLQQLGDRARLRADAASDVDTELLTKVREALVIALKAPLDAAKQMGINASTESFRQARFLMAEFADQQVVAISGAADEDWAALTDEVDTPLHPGIEGMDRVLDEQEPSQVGLAKVYLAALALSWTIDADNDDPERMAKELETEKYRAALYDFIKRVEPPPEETVPLFPDAYRRTQKTTAPDHLPGLRGWVWALVISIILTLLASFPIWWQTTAGARALLERILSLL